MKDGVLVFVDQNNGKLGQASWEALAAGQELAAKLGCKVSCAVFGKSAAIAGQELASTQLDQVCIAEGKSLLSYTPDGYTLALNEIIQSLKPAWVVFNHTYQVRDFAPKLATSLGSGLASDCVGFKVKDQQITLLRQTFQGKFICEVELTGPGPHLLSFQAGIFRKDLIRHQLKCAPVRTFSIDIPPDQIRTQPEEAFREAKQSVDLTQASIIVAVGRGIKGPEGLDVAGKLAEVLGAEIAASRPVCDNGWLPMDRQVGSSGQTIAPKLYLALGISGAIQHQVGMKGSQTIIAINKDTEAPIFEIATYGIIGDLFEVVPLLIKEIEKLKALG